MSRPGCPLRVLLKCVHTLLWVVGLSVLAQVSPLPDEQAVARSRHSLEGAWMGLQPLGF